jgi:hypothetical protein
MRAIVGYCGSLSTEAGHKAARIRAKHRAEGRDKQAEIQRRRAEKELRRIVVWRGPQEVA